MLNLCPKKRYAEGKEIQHNSTNVCCRVADHWCNVLRTLAEIFFPFLYRGDSCKPINAFLKPVLDLIIHSNQHSPPLRLRVPTQSWLAISLPWRSALGLPRVEQAKLTVFRRSTWSASTSGSCLAVRPPLQLRLALGLKYLSFSWTMVFSLLFIFRSWRTFDNLNHEKIPLM